MKRLIKLKSLTLLLLALGLLLPVQPYPALAQTTRTCTITLPPDTYVTMGDGNALLPFTVTNTTTLINASIDTVTLEFDASIYDLSEGINAPAGWKILAKEVGAGQTWIRYSSTGIPYNIPPGGSLTFWVPVIGRSNGQFPNAPNDQIDSLQSKRTEVEGGGYPFSCGTLPSWPRKSLAVSVFPLPLSLPVGAALRVEVQVSNRSSVTQNGITPALSYTGSGQLTPVAGPVPPTVDLASGTSRTVVYTYTAQAPGNVLFRAAASRGPYVTSGVVNSETVWIGAWTSRIVLSSLSAVSGQEIKVWMVVQNNTMPSAGNVVPTLTAGGTASATLVRGPTPVKINSIPPGSFGVFEWTYRITGNPGDSFWFSGYATDKDGRTTNTATSATGRLARYAVIPSPQRIASGSTNFTIDFTVYNNGATPISSVVFTIPPNWAINEAGSGGGYGGNWNKNYNPGKNTMTFTAPSSGQVLPPGSSARFTLAFAAGPTVNVDTPYDFGTSLWSGSVYQGGDTPTVLVTRYKVTLTAQPATLPADGSSTTQLTARLTQNNQPVGGAWISFASTAGTLASPIAITDANGYARVLLTAPISTVTLNAQAKAWYLNAEGYASLTFTGFDNANPLYVGGTLAPTAGQPGETITFSLDAINLGTRDISLSTDTALHFSDGTRTYRATLSAPVSLPVDARRSLTFRATQLDPAFTPGQYYPTVDFVGTVNAQEVIFVRPVTDPFAVGVAALRASLQAAPALVVTGMTINVTLNVTNVGLNPALNVTPSALGLSGSGSASLLSGPVPASLATLLPGESGSFSWTYRADAAGQVRWTGSVSGTDSQTGQNVQSPPATSNTVTIAAPAALQAAFSGPASANIGQTFTIQLQVTNQGGVTANGITPAPPTLSGSGSAMLLSGPDPASLPALQPGESGSFSWTYQGTAAGTVTWNGQVSGVDSVSGQPVSAAASPTSVIIQRPAALSCVLHARPLLAPTGATLYLTMTVANTGDASAVAVVPSPLTPSGSASVTLLDGPIGAPVTIPGNSSRDITWQYRGLTSGTVEWSGWASGQDGNTGASIHSAPCPSNQVIVTPAPYLVSTLDAVPDAVGLGETVAVRMRVQNLGERRALNVTPSSLTLSNPPLFTLTSGPTPPSAASLDPGASVTFTWQYRASPAQTGVNRWRGYATGTDETGMAQLRSATSSSNEVEVYDVVLEKSARTSVSGQAQPGEVFVYQILLRNTSAQTVRIVTISDLLPSGISYVETISATLPPDPPVVNGQTVTWSWNNQPQIPVIPPGGHFELLFRARVASNATGTLCNTAAFTRQGGQVTTRSGLACLEVGYPEYFITTKAGQQVIRVRVRLERGRLIILSWEYLP